RFVLPGERSCQQWLLVQVTGYRSTDAGFAWSRHLDRTPRHDLGAARVEDAPGWRREQRWRRARNPAEGALFVERRKAGNQQLCVRVFWIGEDIPHRSNFHQFSAVHDTDPVD